MKEQWIKPQTNTIDLNELESIIIANARSGGSYGGGGNGPVSPMCRVLLKKD